LITQAAPTTIRGAHTTVTAIIILTTIAAAAAAAAPAAAAHLTNINTSRAAVTCTLEGQARGLLVTVVALVVKGRH
jgi:hypothetical protein